MLWTLRFFTNTPTGRTFAMIGAALMAGLLMLSANGRRVRRLERAKQMERTNATLKRMQAARANTPVDRDSVIERLRSADDW